MINLLPEENKKELRQEYLRRKIVVIGFFIFVTVLTGIVILLPIFWFLDSQEENHKEQVGFSKQRSALSDSQKIISDVEDMNFKLVAFKENQKEGREISQIIKELISAKSENIKIEGLVYNKGVDDKDDTITIRGFSATRNELLNFVDDLRGKKEISGVNLPTSNLLTEGNVDFSLIVSINESFYEK